MITEDYVSFEVAKLLRKRGFDEPCKSVYIEYTDYNDYYTVSEERTDLQLGVFEVLRPTHQMAMKWLREVHNIIFVFKPASFSGDNCTFWTYELWCGDNFEGEILSFKTYEAAVEAALKYSLENLI